MILSKFTNGARKVLNLTSPFYLMVQISRSVTSQIKNEVHQVMHGLFILGGVAIAILLGGFRAIITGALAGVSSANVLASFSEIEEFTKNMLDKLPPAARTSLVYFCVGFLHPFRVVSDTWTELMKISEKQLSNPKFQNIIEIHSKAMALYYLFVGFDPFKAERYIVDSRKIDLSAFHALFEKYYQKPYIM